MLRQLTAVLLAIAIAPSLVHGQRATLSAFQRPRSVAAAVQPWAQQQNARMGCARLAGAVAVGGALVGAATGWLMATIVNVGGDDAEFARTRRRTIVIFALGGAAAALPVVAFSGRCHRD